MTCQSPPEHQSLTRWYIDTRPLTSTSSSLPLVETLQPSDQESVKRFYHLADKHMSLASNLLKYLFIHRTCRLPWDEITISRTPAPHRRPCFIPSRNKEDGTATPNIEFNVSHQASLVALAGCIIPPSTGSPTAAPPQTTIFSHPDPSSAPIQSIPQVGIDITCVDEPSRRRKDSIPTTPQALADFVDIFAEVFSPRELDTIKKIPSTSSVNNLNLAETIKYRLRLFYTYWALKEAYIKMTGEALLAPWLRQLEFTEVVAPRPVEDGHGDSDGSPFGAPYAGIQTWLYGRKVEDVRMEVEAFEKDYLIATAARGGSLGSGSQSGIDPWGKLERIEIERDIAPCARGQCRCLD